MPELAGDIFAYGLAAGLSGSAFLATVVVLTGVRGPLNAAAMWLGLLLVIVPACVGAAWLADVVTAAGGQQVIVTLIQLGLGVVLLATAWRVRPSLPERPDVRGKVAALAARAEALEPRGALRLGVRLALLPKRLAIEPRCGSRVGHGQRGHAGLRHDPAVRCPLHGTGHHRAPVG